MFAPLGDVNSFLTLEVGARTHSSEITRLGAIDLSSDVPARAQQGILGGVDVAGTSVLEYMVPRPAPRFVASSSAPCILAPSMHSKPTTKFPLPRLLSFLPPPSRFLPLPNPPNLLNRRI